MPFQRLITPLIALLTMSAPSAASIGQSASGDNKSAACDALVGKYEGVAKSQAMGDIPITVNIKHTNCKLSGTIESPQGSLAITDGNYADGRVSLKFDAGGNEGTVTAQLKDGKIAGDWTLAGQTGTLELKKAAASESKPADVAKSETKSEMKPAPASDPFSGEWDAAADVQGQSFPFTLKLKVDGDKVTGESSSAQGSATISKGSLTGDKLTIALDTPNGTVTLTCTLKDGKLVGEFDFASQFQGKWEAKKKN